MPDTGFDPARWRETPTLSGTRMRLEPLALEHIDALIEAATDGELWRLWFTSIPEPAGMRAHVETVLARRDAVVFSILEGEWPMVRTHLDHLLSRSGEGSE